MNAFVINEEQLKKAGLAMAVVVVAVFIAGYYLGSKQLFSVNNDAPLTAIDEANKNVVTDASPVLPVSNKALKNEATVKKTEQKNKVKTVDKKKESKKTPAKNNTSKKIVSKKTDKKKTDKKADKKTPNKSTQKPVKKTTDKKVISKKDTPKKTTAVKQSIKNNKEQVKKTPVLAQGAEKLDVVKKAKSEIDSAKTDSLGETGERIYSIQAGMFSSETNANAFIQKLSAKQFDAFVSDFVSSSGATKYNVRIGKFSQRDQARELLQEFQKSFSSPAYVVISKP